MKGGAAELATQTPSKRQKRENKMSGKVVSFYFSVTVYVLITSTEPGTFMALALRVYFPSISAFPDSFSCSNLTLQHCRTPHWLPWRNSPHGLQGTRAYCLWLLYLDENMICWKGSTCFSCCCFTSLLYLSSPSPPPPSFATRASTSSTRDLRPFILLSRSLTVPVHVSSLCDVL